MGLFLGKFFRRKPSIVLYIVASVISTCVFMVGASLSLQHSVGQGISLKFDFAGSGGLGGGGLGGGTDYDAYSRLQEAVAGNSASTGVGPGRELAVGVDTVTELSGWAGTLRDKVTALRVAEGGAASASGVKTASSTLERATDEKQQPSRAGGATHALHPDPQSEMLLMFGLSVNRIAIQAGFLFVHMYAVESFPTSIRTTGSSAAIACGRCGAISAPLVFELVAPINTMLFFLVLVGLLVVNLVLILLIPLVETAGKPLMPDRKLGGPESRGGASRGVLVVKGETGSPAGEGGYDAIERGGTTDPDLRAGKDLTSWGGRGGADIYEHEAIPFWREFMIRRR